MCCWPALLSSNVPFSLRVLQLAGGRFANLMPSDLCFPGAFFSKSIPGMDSTWSYLLA